MALTKVSYSLIKGAPIFVGDIAILDGTTDNTAVLQAAIATGRDIVFPENADCRANAIALAFTTDNQKVSLNGSLLKVERITVDADNVVFDLGGGEIRGPLKVGVLASNTTVGSSTVAFVNASEFSPGDVLASSYGDGVGNEPFNFQTGIAIQSINYSTNVVTLVSPLVGTVVAPAGLYVGTYEWQPLFGIYGSKNLQIMNGKVTRAKAYFFNPAPFGEFGFAPGDTASTHCSNVTFENNGFDQFLIIQASAKFVDCTFGIQYDVAKQGFVYGDDAQITLDRCSMARGNFDNDFTPISSDEFNVYFQGFQGSITVTNSVFDGQNKLPSSAYYNQNTLHSFKFSGGGATYDGAGGRPSAAYFANVFFENCQFYNYSRHIVSSTVVASDYSLVLDSVSLNNCIINAEAYAWSAISGKTVTIKNFTFNGCNIYSTTTNIFGYASNVDFTAYFNNCYIKLTGTQPLFINATLVKSNIDSSPTVKVGENCLFDDVLVTGITSISPSTADVYTPILGSFVVDNAAFDDPTEDGKITDILRLGYTAAMLPYGQNGGVTIKSTSGFTVYNVASYNTESYLSANLNLSFPSLRFDGLKGTDWLIGGAGATVKSLAGAVYKTTFNIVTYLTANAAGSATSIVVNNVGSSPNYLAVGDHVFIQMNDGSVFTTTIKSGYTPGLTTVPLDNALPSATSANNGVSFLRIVAL